MAIREGVHNVKVIFAGLYIFMNDRLEENQKWG